MRKWRRSEWGQVRWQKTSQIANGGLKASVSAPSVLGNEEPGYPVKFYAAGTRISRSALIIQPSKFKTQRTAYKAKPRWTEEASLLFGRAVTNPCQHLGQRGKLKFMYCNPANTYGVYAWLKSKTYYRNSKARKLRKLVPSNFSTEKTELFSRPSVNTDYSLGAVLYFICHRKPWRCIMQSANHFSHILGKLMTGGAPVIFV